VTNARFASLHGLSLALLPFEDARATPQIRALVTSGICFDRRRGKLPSAARRQAVALRLRFAKRSSPPAAPLSLLDDRRPKPKSEPIMD
jgi:hypothetical protein